jgi:hypothetical protein
MITKKQYVEYLISTPKNCTCTYLADHLEDVSHDVVNDFLPGLTLRGANRPQCEAVAVLRASSD